MDVNLIYVESRQSQAADFASALSEEFSQIEINLVSLSAAGQSRANLVPAPSVVLFGELLDDASIGTWHQQRPAVAHMSVIPLSLLAGRNVPPGPLAGLKSRHWPLDRKIIFDRVGAILGLRLRPGEQKLFISFRTSDGEMVANKLNTHLSELGYRPWLDEAKDPVSGDPNMPLADDVGATIEKNLEEASAIVLLDTPNAPGSHWIHREVQLALGLLVPILPVVFYDEGTTFSGCRFRELQGLHRAVPCPIPTRTTPNLGDAALDTVVSNLENYLRAVYHRRVIQAAALPI